MKIGPTVGEVDALRDARVPERLLPRPAVDVAIRRPIPNKAGAETGPDHGTPSCKLPSQQQAPDASRVPRQRPAKAHPPKRQLITPSRPHTYSSTRPPTSGPGLAFLIVVGILLVLIMALAKLGVK